ncbi:MAG: hypothetical protein KAV41_02675 [Candidatus Pacebacteria bacterium]|nr:hypothetical protein [Candidatus Paceibacterota bacterium]
MKDIRFELPRFLNQLQKSGEFKTIYKQTKKYLEKCEKEWNKNFDFTDNSVRELTGLNLDKTFTVYITHPSLKNGQYWGDNNITWGATEKWENYSTIYIWHEIMHAYFDKTDLSHAIIELITDEELRKNLNKEKYPPFAGHKNLAKLKRKILPFWKEYLKLKNKNIRKFQKLLQYKTIKNI